MTAQPYVTGFLEEIVGVHFGGGNWLAVWIFPDNTGTTSLQVGFPNVEKGTPGLDCLLNNAAPPGYFNLTGVARVLSAADLKQTRVTGATLKLTTFGASKTIVESGNPKETVTFIRMDGPLNKPLTVRTYITSTGDSSQPIQVAMFDAKKIKAGYKLQAYRVIPGPFPAVPDPVNGTLSPGLNPDVGGFDFAGYVTSINYDWRVDPKNLTVSFIG